MARDTREQFRPVVRDVVWRDLRGPSSWCCRWDDVGALGIYAAAALVVGALAKNGSVRYGIPYTRYSFRAQACAGKELFLGDVPLMVTLSYTFMSYFAFATARLCPCPVPGGRGGRMPVR